MECTHLLDNIKVDDRKVYSVITKSFSCSVCSVTVQNWLCLHCGAVNCGRYVKGHAQQHAETTGHQLCMSCDVYSIYCYKCDEYVSTDLDNRIDKIRQILMKTGQNDSAVTLERNEETIKNGKERTEDNTLEEKDNNISNGENEVTPITSCSNTPSENAPDIGESKSVKSIKNPDEPVRSLRPRSQKRTYSGENSSTENNTATGRTRKAPRNGKSQRDKKIVGLKNLGNTCFMNAVLQSLNNIQEFSYYFSQLPSLEVKSNGRKVYHSRSYTRQEMHDVLVAEELRKVILSLNTGGCGSKGAISPECLFHVIWKVVPRFHGYQQQDAHEFLRYMLDRLHTELLQLLPPDKMEGDFVPKAPSPAASIVTAVFGGTLQSEVRCLACGTQSNKFDPFVDLSLEMPDPSNPETSLSLADCLTSFVQVEELEDTERYFCSSCKCKQKSTKQFKIRRLPNVLCLHLKRFRWNNCVRVKVDTTLSFPLQALDMSKFALSGAPDTRCPARTHLYDLAAVIVHHGSGASSGHYTAFAINDEQWFHFNDQTVRASDAAAVAGCKPYILFYIRRELALPTS